MVSWMLILLYFLNSMVVNWGLAYNNSLNSISYLLCCVYSSLKGFLKSTIYFLNIADTHPRYKCKEIYRRKEKASLL